MYRPYYRSEKTFAAGRLKRGEMNNTEKAYDRYLQELLATGKILWYRFEGIKFRLAKDLSYLPDFAVMLPDGQIEIHEVKGAMRIFQDDAKAKIKMAAAMFPFRFLVVIPRPKKYGGGWEVREIDV